MFSIVPSTGRYDVLGMRQGGKTMATVAAPGEPGWLGNPYVAVDAGGTLSRAEATDRFKRLIFQRAKDPAWADAFRALRGKTVGYYRPNEQDIHLHALQDWLSYDAGQPVIRNGMIKWLPDDSVFVFGSNAAGRHGKGAAATAAQRYGAQMGVGEGLTGRAYALPTKDGNLNTLSLDSIAQGLTRLGQSARENPAKKFYLTRVGQGLAGISEEQIRPLVEAAGLPENVLPWWNWEGGGATSSVGDVLDAAIAPARTYELSRAGDGRFSAFNARIKGRGNRTIEELYQVDGKGYPSISAGKGRPPLTQNFDSEGFYEGLWREWAAENPDLMNELTGLRQQGYDFTDKFAGRSRVNQASTLTKLADELLSAPAAATAADALDAAIAPAAYAPAKGFYAGIGSRETPAKFLPILNRIAAVLEEAGYGLRSGGADGADRAFEAGVKDPRNKRIYLPWDGFGGAHYGEPGIIDPSTLSGMSAAEAMVDEYHPNPAALKPGARQTHARNTFQVLGDDLKDPSKFVISWTKNGTGVGGTGQAIRIAEGNNVPVIDLGNFGMMSEAQRQLDAGTFLDWVLSGAKLPERARGGEPTFYRDDTLFQAGMPLESWEQLPYSSPEELAGLHGLADAAEMEHNLLAQKVELRDRVSDYSPEAERLRGQLARSEQKLRNLTEYRDRISSLARERVGAETSRTILADPSFPLTSAERDILQQYLSPSLPKAERNALFLQLGQRARSTLKYDMDVFDQNLARNRSAIRGAYAQAITGNPTTTGLALGDPETLRRQAANSVRVFLSPEQRFAEENLLNAIARGGAEADTAITSLSPAVRKALESEIGRQNASRPLGNIIQFPGSYDLAEQLYNQALGYQEANPQLKLVNTYRKTVNAGSMNNWGRRSYLSDLLNNTMKAMGKVVEPIGPAGLDPYVASKSSLEDSFFDKWFWENVGDTHIIKGNDGPSPYTPLFGRIVEPAPVDAEKYISDILQTEASRGGHLRTFNRNRTSGQGFRTTDDLNEIISAAEEGLEVPVTLPEGDGYGRIEGFGRRPFKYQAFRKGVIQPSVPLRDRETVQSNLVVPRDDATYTVVRGRGTKFTTPTRSLATPDTRTQRFTGQQTSWGNTSDPEVAAMQARSEALAAEIGDSMSMFGVEDASIIPPSEGQIAAATTPVSFGEVYEPGSKEYALQHYMANTKLKKLNPGQRRTGTEQYTVNPDGSYQLLDNQAEYLAERVQRSELQALEDAAARQEADALANEAGMPRVENQALSETKPIEVSYEGDREAYRFNQRLKNPQRVSSIQEVVDAAVQADAAARPMSAMERLRYAIQGGGEWAGRLVEEAPPRVVRNPSRIASIGAVLRGLR